MEPSESVSIDWNAVRQTALDCLDAAWSLVCLAESSQEADYDADRAALHLVGIDEACDTFLRARRDVFSPSLFDSIALATVGEGPRPDFHVGPVNCATVHETAFEFLRGAIGQVENGLWGIVEEEGADDSCRP